jgi:hypothetical protein
VHVSTATALEARYGRTPQRRRRGRLIAVLAAAGVLIVVVAWGVWVGLLGPAAGLDSRTLGYTVQPGDAAVEIRYEVTVDAGRTASCALQAMNADFETVGWKIVDLGASENGTRHFTDVLRTSEPPVTGLIYRCWLT